MCNVLKVKSSSLLMSKKETPTLKQVSFVDCVCALIKTLASWLRHFVFRLSQSHEWKRHEENSQHHETGSSSTIKSGKNISYFFNWTIITMLQGIIQLEFLFFFVYTVPCNTNLNENNRFKNVCYTLSLPKTIWDMLVWWHFAYISEHTISSTKLCFTNVVVIYLGFFSKISFQERFFIFYFWVNIIYREDTLLWNCKNCLHLSS